MADNNNNSNEPTVNIGGDFNQPVAIDPLRGYAVAIDPSTGEHIDGASRFSSAGVPAKYQNEGGKNFTGDNFHAARAKNWDGKDLKNCARALAALEDDEFDEFEELRGKLSHGMIVGSGVNHR